MDVLMMRFLAVSALVGALLCLGGLVEMGIAWFASGRARALKCRCRTRYRAWVGRRADRRAVRRLKRDLLSAKGPDEYCRRDWGAREVNMLRPQR